MTEQIIYGVEGESADFKAAVASAHRTFKFFWRELSWEQRRIVKALDMAAVKVSFATDSTDPDGPSVENMWVTDIGFDGHTLTGVLMNEPRWVSQLSSGDPVSVPLAHVNDWMYVCGGRVYGGFTIDALRSGMSREERAAHDQAWGLDFGEAGRVALVPPANGKAPVLFNRPLNGRADGKALDKLERTEHPMALNVQSTVEQGLRDDPSLISDYDDGGWQLLHREALAGNCNFVITLLYMGADAAALNSQGKSALMLARLAGWPRLVELLESESPNLQRAMQYSGFSLWPIGLGMVAVALGGLYFVAFKPLMDVWAGVRAEAPNKWLFTALFMLLGYGLVSCTGPWYFRLRERTPMWGKSRAMDVIALMGWLALGFVLQEALADYLSRR
ncbi:DUF2314 domain-containing protein [Pseudomonas alliivorans]|uniref:DUF2314 domain-containing protein n=1 Tax=Pseudomonas alliivorans TaxID=2810613 RepID=UPI00403A8486